MDLTILYAIIGSTLTILATMIGMFLWLRAEANADRRETRAELNEFKSKIDSFREMWAAESKDFHARLYNLEERYKLKIR